VGSEIWIRDSGRETHSPAKSSQGYWRSFVLCTGVQLKSFSSGALCGHLTVPGDKSISHLALMLLAKGARTHAIRYGASHPRGESTPPARTAGDRAADRRAPLAPVPQDAQAAPPDAHHVLLSRRFARFRRAGSRRCRPAWRHTAVSGPGQAPVSGPPRSRSRAPSPCNRLLLGKKLYTSGSASRASRSRTRSAQQ